MKFFKESVGNLIKDFKLQKLDGRCVEINEMENRIGFTEEYKDSNIQL